MFACGQNLWKTFAGACMIAVCQLLTAMSCKILKVLNAPQNSQVIRVDFTRRNKEEENGK